MQFLNGNPIIKSIENIGRCFDEGKFTKVPLFYWRFFKLENSMQNYMKIYSEYNSNKCLQTERHQHKSGQLRDKFLLNPQML